MPHLAGLLRLGMGHREHYSMPIRCGNAYFLSLPLSHLERYGDYRSGFRITPLLQQSRRGGKRELSTEKLTISNCFHGNYL